MHGNRGAASGRAGPIDRRTVLKLLGATGLAGAAASPARAAAGERGEPSDGFDPIEATASEIRARYLTGRTTARTVVERYLERVWEYESELEAIITVNPRALERADELDAALASDGPVGPLHGVPILLKDNNDTGDMPTTAGSVALANSVPPDDATIVARMREAGGIVLAKANLHEFAFGYDTVSSLGGVTRNPYDLDRYAGGSSGGTGAGIAANLGVLGTGTDTGGSVRVPAAACNLVGLRPSTGLISRDGIVPLSLTEDTAGPMTRTVADAALLTDVMAGYDPADPETAESVRRTPHREGKRYVDHLNEDGLDGARIGVYRDYVGPDEDADAEAAADARRVAAVFDAALAEMEGAGATVVDPVEAPPDDLVSAANVESGDEFNRDLNAYLAELEGDAPDSLAEIVASGEYAPAVCESIREREAVDEDALDENVEYLRGLSKRDDLQQLVLGTMAEADLDAIVYPTLSRTPPLIDGDGSWGSNAQLTPALEFPSITVPAGFTEDPSLPVGVEFMAREFEEALLFELAYSYERATRHRRAPDGFGPVSDPVGDWDSEAIAAWNEGQRRRRTVERTGCCD